MDRVGRFPWWQLLWCKVVHRWGWRIVWLRDTGMFKNYCRKCDRFWLDYRRF